MFIKDIYILCLAYIVRFYIYLPEYLGMADSPDMAATPSTTVHRKFYVCKNIQMILAKGGAKVHR